MRRIQLYIDEELDDRVGAEARRKGESKAAVIRRAVRDHLGKPERATDPLDELVGAFDGEPVEDIDAVIYER